MNIQHLMEMAAPQMTHNSSRGRRTPTRTPAAPASRHRQEEAVSARKIHAARKNNQMLDRVGAPGGGKKGAGKPDREERVQARREADCAPRLRAHPGLVQNNTIVTIAPIPEGNVVAWSSAGGIGFKGSRKGTPFAATQAAISAGNAAKAFGMRSVEVKVKGPGAGRESAIRALQTIGIDVK